MDAREEAEFRAFVVARWGRLVRTAYLLTGDRHLAEDVTQTALSRVYAGWASVVRAGNPDAYVHAILVRCNAQRFRRRRVGEDLGREPPDRAGEDATARVEQRQALLSALADLPARQRAVVVLRYWADFSEAQTADIVGCSIGTVKSQAAKALAKLRVHAALADVPGAAKDGRERR